MPNLFEYTDYRKYLEDYQFEASKKNPSFSHRYFAQKVGYNSTGLFANIISGRRNLSDMLIGKFSKALKLNKKEELYFEALVRFCQAKSIDDKNRHYLRLLQFSPFKEVTVSRERHEFYSKWWYSAIRELLYYYRFKDDYRSLGRQLDPPVSADQAKDAIETLERLGMIEKDSEGYYRQTASFITTGELRERSLNVMNFQIATLDLAKDSLQRHLSEKRNISTLTVTLSPESVDRINDEIDQLQKKILSIAEEDQKVNSVYQINFQMFPLTKTGKAQ